MLERKNLLKSCNDGFVRDYPVGDSFEQSGRFESKQFGRSKTEINKPDTICVACAYPECADISVWDQRERYNQWNSGKNRHQKHPKCL